MRRQPQCEWNMGKKWTAYLVFVKGADKIVARNCQHLYSHRRIDTWPWMQLCISRQGSDLSSCLHGVKASSTNGSQPRPYCTAVTARCVPRTFTECNRRTDTDVSNITYIQRQNTVLGGSRCLEQRLDVVAPTQSASTGLDTSAPGVVKETCLAITSTAMGITH